MQASNIGRHRLRLGLSIFYGIAGVFHLMLPGPFLSIVPQWVPFPAQVVALTGFCEIAGAAGLLVRRLRKWAAVGLALYAVCVFPANIKHAIDALILHEASPWAWFYHIPRLALQPVIVWAALFAGSVSSWPSRAS
jgi:uncharacterized membrane protein